MRARWVDGALVLAAIASAVTAAWLLFVILTVLPSRDPDSIPGWTIFSIGLLAFVALTSNEVRADVPSQPAQVAFMLASVVAIVIGAWILLVSISASVGFEGYLVVIGAVVLFHGIAAGLHVLPDIRTAIRPSR